MSTINVNSSGMNTSRMRRPVPKNSTQAVSVTSSYGLGSMNTMAPDAPASHTSARCSASTPAGADVGEWDVPAVAA
ncbi:hypothetical protein ACVII1_001996 [Bradyrhizobium elkanii]